MLLVLIDNAVDYKMRIKLKIIYQNGKWASLSKAILAVFVSGKELMFVQRLRRNLKNENKS